MPVERPSSASSPSSPADGPARRTGLYLIVRRAPDYPAAHSGDTIWYAVDANGAIAVFSSGSAGPVPKKAAHRAYSDIPRLLRILGGDWDDDDDEFDVKEAFEAAADLGLFVYEVISWEMEFVDTYERTHVPRRPLHLDELPPKLRKNFAKCTLPTVDFAKREELQVVALVACDLYWDEAVGYFAPGHKEVRPIPGKEEEYRAALPQLRKENRRFRFADAPDAEKK